MEEEKKEPGTKKAKLLVIGDLVTPTGFSRVLHNLIKYWKEEYEIVGVGVNYHGDPHPYDFPIYPANNGVGVYGENRVCDLINAINFDIIFILNDPWVINSYLRVIKEKITKSLPKIVVYFPVDATEHNPEWYDNFDIVTEAVTYTKFGEWVVKDANPVLDVKVIPHGNDTKTFFKLFATKQEAKEHFFKPFADKMSSLSDSFIVLNGNRNQPRKRLDITMKGFAKFARDKPENVRIYMHCGLVDQSVNIDTLAKRYGISNRLIISSTKKGVQVLPDWRLNEVYNACDVGINTSMGEGWGLVNTEHASTGAVQLVPSHSACKELFNDCGVLMNTVAEFTLDNSMTVGKLVSADEVARKLEFLYTNPEKREHLADLGYKKFTSDEYSWKTIAGTWMDLFIGVLNNDTTNMER